MKDESRKIPPDSAQDGKSKVSAAPEQNEKPEVSASPDALIMSAKFAPGHFSHMLAFYRLFEASGFHAALYVRDAYQSFADDAPEYRCITLDAPEVHAPDILLIYNLSMTDMKYIQRFRRENPSMRVWFAYHEPWAGFRAWAAHLLRGRESLTESVKALGRYVFVQPVMRQTETVLLPSEEALSCYRVHCAGFHPQTRARMFPLVFTDEAAGMRVAPPDNEGEKDRVAPPDSEGEKDSAALSDGESEKIRAAPPDSEGEKIRVAPPDSEGEKDSAALSDGESEKDSAALSDGESEKIRAAPPDGESAGMSAAPPERKYFSFIATAIRNHGFDLFLDYVRYKAADPDALFRIDTRSDIRRALRDDVLQTLIREKRLLIRQGRPLSNAEINAAYASSACVWLFYRRSFQSGVLCKAMMFGAPVIASDTGSFREFLNGDNGVLLPVNAGNADIDRAYQSIKARQREMSGAARETWLRRFDYRAQLDAFQEIIRG